MCCGPGWVRCRQCVVLLYNIYFHPTSVRPRRPRLYSETVRGTAGLSTLSCPVTDGGVRQARVHLPAGRPEEGGEEQIPGVCPGVGGLPPRE